MGVVVDQINAFVATVVVEVLTKNLEKQEEVSKVDQIVMVDVL